MFCGLLSSRCEKQKTKESGGKAPHSKKEGRAIWAHHRAEVNGITLHYVAAGSGPLVVLLHGFPEFWYSWRYQIPALAGAGFRVLAPDLRGYNESDKPRGVDSYRVEALVADVAALIEHAGYQRAHVVGHDWGGAIAWAFAMRYPERLERLAILNAPHPAAFLRELRTIGQLRRSWYILFFQLPGLPELMLRAGDCLSRSHLSASARSPGRFQRGGRGPLQAGAGAARRLTAALNYYRAAYRGRARIGRRMRPIEAPTLLLWGEQDAYLGLRLTEGLGPWVHDLRIERIPDASHWVQIDAAEQVNRSLLSFLPTPTGAGARPVCGRRL